MTEIAMNIPKELLYQRSHEWILIEGDVGTVGITDFAQAQLGDLTFVELPAMDAEFAREDEAVVIESVKAASDVYSPVTGTVIELNSALEDAPELINNDPYGEGWIFKIRLSNPEEAGLLMDCEAYEELTPEE